MALPINKLLGFGLGLVWLAGCTAATEGPGDLDEGVAQSERRDLKLSKGVPPGSCASKTGAKYCGGKSKKGACWCDAACAQYGDCCADADAICNLVPPGGECAAGACGPAMGMPIKLCPDGVHTAGPTGKCLKNTDGTCGWEISTCPPAQQFCGGIAAFQCPAGKICVDNPNDGCDPNNGGADCGGICVDAPPPAPTASCAGHCGGAAADKSCYCDSLCQGYGDCCGDYAAACGKRTPVSGGCAKNRGDTCSTDADCATGGCGGDLCFNPSMGAGISTCECTAPTNVAGCGCVAGKCSWYN
ncbi:MAG: hypothetical protein L6Q84_33115 [Polyangiaceae bacterium]|nr:hypothetical protein [Polyangiaceae bacterium]